MSCCEKAIYNGPGYSCPKDAYLNGQHETVLFTTCVRPKKDLPDYLAIIDVKPDSKTFSQIIERIPMKFIGDELHHSGWNTCSSCFGDTNKKRNKIILPCLNSDRIYIIKIISPEESFEGKYEAKLDYIIDPKELHNLNVSAPHTTHCLPNGNIMISTLGDSNGQSKGSFLIVQNENNETYKAKKLWNHTNVQFGYDFWYQPMFNVLVSSEWGSPNCFKTGFNFEHLQQYGSKMHFWNWKTGKHIKSYDLNDIIPGTKMPLEVRFLHDPNKPIGYVGCALSGNIFRFIKENENNENNEEWKFEEIIKISSKKVSGWIFSELPALITDILISMDDRFLYVSCWGFGEIRQYSIIESKPKLVGILRIGGIPTVYSGIEILNDPESDLNVKVISEIKNQKLLGGSQMIQLSLDGKRLYITNSLHSAWDKQFYPDMFENGSQMILVDVNTEKGGLKINENFIVNFSNEPNGPSLAHEMRYPGGDCTSDIFLSSKQSQ